MALRCLTLMVALSLLVSSGCRGTRSSYQPVPGPAVVAVQPVAPAPCPPPGSPPLPPPPPGVLAPR